MSIDYIELVKTVIFNVIETDDDGLIYRLEILKSPNGFYGQLYRQESYSLKCTFAEFTPDEIIYVLDYHTLPDLDEQIFENEEACLNYVISSLNDKFLNP